MAQPQTSPTTWAIIACCCLFLGLAAGYVIFGGQRGPEPVVSPAAPAAAPAANTPQAGLFDEQQAQVLRTVMAKDPKNAQAPTQLGNMLYDAGRYADAIPVYQQAFALDPRNVGLSTDLGTALWYSGRPDEALAQFEKSLAINPDHAQTLFNQGVVRKDGKQDPTGAIRSWERLLAANPTYPDRQKVEQLIEQARQQVGTTPIAPARSTK
ncbi:MAG TPA: tetratricopeptide repeat protein [Vicinamibacterales bacterium]|jgi:cytochrome c-type biogenesis protein CcmH/NrfG